MENENGEHIDADFILSRFSCDVKSAKSEYRRFLEAENGIGLNETKLYTLQELM